MADTKKPAHTFKEKQEGLSETAVKAFRPQSEKIIAGFYIVLTVMRLTWWLAPMWNAPKYEDSTPSLPTSSAPTIAGYQGKSCFSTVVHADTSQATWPILPIPANGDSPMIPVPCPGTHPVFTNAGYEIHVVYEDQRTPECIMGSPRPTCPNQGKVKGEYLHDTTGSAHTELYAYALDN